MLLLVLLLLVVGAFSSIPTTRIPLIETTSGDGGWGQELDNDNGTEGWRLSEYRRWEDWFYYFPNLTKEGLTPAATNYFSEAHVDLSPLLEEAHLGIWVAFNSTIPPYPNKPYPTIELAYPTFRAYNLQLIFYAHSNAQVIVHTGASEVHECSNMEYTNRLVGWTMCSYNITGQFTLELITTSQEDFILIDKVSCFDNPLTTTKRTPRPMPEITYPTEEESTTGKAGEEATTTKTTREPPQSNQATNMMILGGANFGLQLPSSFFIYWLLSS